MSKKSEFLRALVTERLTAAAEEIFALFERTIAEYEEELRHFKDQENQRKRQLLDSAREAQVELQKQEKQGVQPQTQSLCLDEGLPDSPQTREKSDESSVVRLENYTLPSCPQVVKSEMDELLSEIDEDADDKGDFEACTSSAQHTEAETDADFYDQVYEEDPDRNLSQQYNMEHFPASDDAFTEGGNASMNNGSSEDKKDKLKKHQCYFCEKKFKDRHSLKRHTVVHTGEKPFQCPVCAKSYSYKETLMSHMTLHGWSKKPNEEASSSKNAPYTCPICMKCVTTSFALRSHILIHTGEKPYSCPVCSKTFSQKVYVRKHMRTHTGEKPFTCLECDMRFSRKSNLNRHLKVHAAQKAV